MAETENPTNSKRLTPEDLGLLHQIISTLDESTLSRYLSWVETGRFPRLSTAYKTKDVDDLREEFFEALVSRNISWREVQQKMDSLEGGKKRKRKTKRRGLTIKMSKYSI